MENNLYSKIADQTIKQIKDKVYKPGDKLPSVRAMAKRRSISVATVLSAYNILEDRGFVEVKPKSGYYVRRSPSRRHDLPSISQEASQPKSIAKADRILQVVRDCANPDFINLSLASPDGSFLAINQLKKSFSSIIRNKKVFGIGYDDPKGDESLRAELAKRSIDSGMLISPDEIIITPGCQNAIELSLRALTRPGDIVAVESPGYYGLLQLIEVCGLKAIEIPANVETGISIDALKLALEQWPIKTIISIPSCNNPMGSIMPDKNKKKILELIYSYNIPLIEDDIYADLTYQEKRPRTIKSFDTKGQVILCSSVSKTVDPGLRVGWVIPGAYQKEIEYQNFVTNINTARAPQLAVAALLSHGGYDRHLRFAREAYRQRKDQLLDLIDEHFPKETRLSNPKGGFVLWVQFPEEVSAYKLYLDARSKKISISPGYLFSLDDSKYHSSIRLAYSQPWSNKHIEAIKILGELISKQIESSRVG